MCVCVSRFKIVVYLFCPALAYCSPVKFCPTHTRTHTRTHARHIRCVNVSSFLCNCFVSCLWPSLCAFFLWEEDR
uniref:Uncharacterized protein n=1 Tax=Anopheles quadriannulatus TaxID=34691 RepID=A0A182XQ76_ANOQN